MKNKTDITIILDRSGSMESVKTDTIGGFNSFIGEQKKVEGEAFLTLVQFDDQYEIDYTATPINSAQELSDRTFQPRGMTALFDAIGKTINAVGKRLSEIAEAERPTQVVVAIMTDGQENASKEFQANVIEKMIAHQRDVYQWQFIFIGANQDAVLSAKSIGIAQDSALSYAANARGTKMAFKSLSSNVRAYRMNVTRSASFADEDREEQLKAGVKH